MKHPLLFFLALLLAPCAFAGPLEDQVAKALQNTPHPRNTSEFNAIPHLPGHNQGKTLICWSFATTSFFESEMLRLKMQPEHLSVVYPVRCIYLDKVKQFIASKGASRFSPGDLFTGSFDACRDYGAMPAVLYDKQVPGKPLDQSQLYADLEQLMTQVKLQGRWDETTVLKEAQQALDQYLGQPPAEFSRDEKKHTPRSYLADKVKLPWSDYLMVTSFESAPFNTYTALNVPDNWRRNTNFFNVPLPLFYESLKEALQNGYSVAADIDISEVSYKTTGRYCIILDSDIPAASIDQPARELRFRNGSTTDDHLVHLVGFKNISGQDWFLVKDSWKLAWQNGNSGYVFMHSSYVKLKLLAYALHRDAVPKIKALLPK